MKAIKNWRRAILCISSLVAFSLPIQAAVISYSSNWFVNDSIIWNSEAKLRGENFSARTFTGFNLFDESLGTLNSATFRFSNMIISSTARAVFQDTDWFSDTSGSLSLNNPEIVVNDDVIGSHVFSGSSRNASCSDSSGTGGARCVATLNLEREFTSSSGIEVTDSSLLANLTGTGIQSLSIFLGGRLVGRETGGDDGFIDNMTGNLSGSGTLLVSYDYSEHEEVDVPEPPTLALLLFGILGLIAVKKRQAQ